MADVFISYKRDNKDAVQRIVQDLRASGLSVWWDQDIAPDAPWEATIERELEQAKVVLVAWSSAAIGSENVKAEARRARTQGKLIQVFVEPCQPPLFFGERQGVDLTGWNGDAGDSRFKAVVGAAKAIIAGRRPPDGVGYAPRKRSMAPAVLGVGLAALLIAAALNMERVRALACSSAKVWCEQELSEAASSETPSAVGAQAPGRAAAQSVEAGAQHRLEVPSGHAVDFDTATTTDRLSDASDFVFAGDSTGFSVTPAAPPAVIGQAISGTPTPAACGLELGRPGISWQIPMANDVGEFQCFVTREGREGAYVLRRLGPTSVQITYTLWD